MCLWRGSKIHANTSLETQSNEQPNHTQGKVLWYSYMCLIVVSVFCYSVWKEIIGYHEPDTQIRFSIISVPVSELNLNASSTPVITKIFIYIILFNVVVGFVVVTYFSENSFSALYFKQRKRSKMVQKCALIAYQPPSHIKVSELQELPKISRPCSM